MAVAALGGVPTRDDAAQAAEVLVAAGVAEVLLFGSVVRETATGDSDIDLVAIFADMDYSERHMRRQELEAAVREVVAWPVQVHVTDRPEWRARTELVSTSFERRVSGETVRLAAASVEGPVDWGKEMVLPMSDPLEALSYFRTWVLPALDGLANATSQGLVEKNPAASAAEREEARLNRMVRLCASAAGTVETALKALAVLYGEPTPTPKHLKRNGHRIRRSLARLERDVPAPANTAVREVFRRHGIDLDDLSKWREEGTNPDDRDVVWATADRLAETYATVASEIAGVLADHLQSRLDPAEPELAAAVALRTLLAAEIAAHDVRLGLPASGGLDV